MLRYLFSKLYRIVIMRIYSDSTILLMELKSPANPQSIVSIREVTETNVEDALNFQTKAQIQTFRSFLRNGNKGYYGYMDDHSVHRSWVVRGPARVALHKFYFMNILENEVFIQFCETAPSARGKNIFAHVLSYIGRQSKGARVLTSVDAENSSSIKSMTKAGFLEVDRKRIKMILGIRFVT